MNFESIVDHAKKYLEKCIITGEIRPGQRIKEEEIASKLEISRPPIREAFKMLEAEGLVLRKPRKGAFVPEITAKDIWEIYTLKMVLYGLASELVVDKISDKEIQYMENIAKKMEECVRKEPPDIIKYQSLNDAFHLVTIDVVGNDRLKKIILSLNNQLHRFSYKSLADRSHLKSSLRYHQKILAAIKNKNKDLAETLTKEHAMMGLKIHQAMAKTENHEVIR